MFSAVWIGDFHGNSHDGCCQGNDSAGREAGWELFLLWGNRCCKRKSWMRNLCLEV